MPAGLSHRRVIIVGAGQAGLAVAAALSAKGLRPQHEFVVIDAAPEGQRSWGSRWHSMMLLSDARHSSLPTRRLPGDQRRHPRVDEMVDYLRFVEAGLRVETVWGIRAVGVEHRGNGSTLLLATTAGEVQTRNVVCATGAAAHPRVPKWASGLTVPGVALHSRDYLYPRQIPTSDVLIVGGGNSGVQLARELSASHRVTLAVRTPRRLRPTAGYAAAAGESVSWLSRERRAEPVFGDSYEQLRRAGVTLRPAVTAAAGTTVSFADSSQAQPGSVILATGYLPGDGWLPDAARKGTSRRTLTGMPGLFVAGMPRYGGRGADTIAGVWRDATTIAHHIIHRP
ncbi:NAD(P)-binding domain-containing protein [Microbacterium imperiale]|uniref:Oxidoreductase n=1 Tax=Microbacterium imperiale TaxID=33884 RepID=A0A9W6HHG5_9MICO|nr:NAD(P)-binding domain-containing protein [Microbacterium imperiale]BFE41167.1 NAD(P)/FAD-dependent oxidoreductase [Microbacterium imperiale]GLJ80170.1 oxidoreductase [Microbacterium imperiale]